MTRIRHATHDIFRSFDIRNFRLFFAGQLVSQVGNWLTLVAQTLLVLKLTDSGYALGALAAAQFGPILLIGAFAGLVADRSDKRRLLMVVQALAMAQSFVLAALGFMSDPPLLAIYAVAVVSGIATAFDNPARRSFVVELVPEDRIPNAVSLNSALMTGSRIIGPALAGLLVTTVGFGWCFLLDAISYVPVILAYWRMNTAELRQAPVTPKGRGQVREGLRYARSIPELWVPLVMMTVIGTLAFNFQTVLPLFATRDLEGSDVTFTWLLSTLSFGSLVAALAAARRTTVDVRTVSRNAIVFGIGMTLLTFAPNQPAAFVTGFLVGFGSIMFMTAATAITQLAANPSMRGRVLALQAIVFLGSTPIGGPILGAIAETFGARYGIAVGAAATLAAGSFGLFTVRRSRRLPVEEVEAIPFRPDAPGDLTGLDTVLAPKAS
ncbi:MAG TPA: MFS transporter [Acidimicrobiia bacterium]|nr:MFS transporter [Acidimicrobiia bacterium]